MHKLKFVVHNIIYINLIGIKLNDKELHLNFLLGIIYIGWVMSHKIMSNDNKLLFNF